MLRQYFLRISALVILLSTFVSPTQAQHYRITWLDAPNTLPDDYPSDASLRSFANGINDRGQIVGTAQRYIPSTQQILQSAFRWESGQFQWFEPTTNFSSEGKAINRHGEMVVNYATERDIPGRVYAVTDVWNGMTSRTLPALSPDTYPIPFTRGEAINNDGTVVGFASTSIALDPYAVTWNARGGQIIDTGFGQSGYIHDSRANDINSHEQIIGTATIDTLAGQTVAHGFVTMNGVPLDLGAWVYPTTINDAGNIAGHRNIYDSITGRYTAQGFIWKNGILTAIPSPDNWEWDGYLEWGRQTINDMNELGDIVGGSYLWRDSSVFSLNTLTDLAADDILVEAKSINNFGQIVGYGRRGTFFGGNGGVHTAFILTPVPEPDTMVFFISALSVFALIWYRKYKASISASRAR